MIIHGFTRRQIRMILDLGTKRYRPCERTRISLVDANLLRRGTLTFTQEGKRRRRWYQMLTRAIAHEACTLLEVAKYMPAEYGDVLVKGSPVLEKAIDRARRMCRLRYRYAGGKCLLCDGNAWVCMPRHARGRSCA